MIVLKATHLRRAVSPLPDSSGGGIGGGGGGREVFGWPYTVGGEGVSPLDHPALQIKVTIVGKSEIPFPLPPFLYFHGDSYSAGPRTHSSAAAAHRT